MSDRPPLNRHLLSNSIHRAPNKRKSIGKILFLSLLFGIGIGLLGLWIFDQISDYIPEVQIKKIQIHLVPAESVGPL